MKLACGQMNCVSQADSRIFRSCLFRRGLPEEIALSVRRDGQRRWAVKRSAPSLFDAATAEQSARR